MKIFTIGGNKYLLTLQNLPDRCANCAFKGNRPLVPECLYPVDLPLHCVSRGGNHILVEATPEQLAECFAWKVTE